MSDKWADFDKVLLSAGGLLMNGDDTAHVHPIHGAMAYHEVAIQDDIEDHMDNGVWSPWPKEVPEAEHVDCETFEELEGVMRMHPCKYGQFITHNIPRQLSVGYLCTECAFNCSIRVIKLGQLGVRSPRWMKMLSKGFGTQESIRLANIYLKQGPEAEEWKAWLAAEEIAV